MIYEIYQPVEYMSLTLQRNHKYEDTLDIFHSSIVGVLKLELGLQPPACILHFHGIFP